MEEVDGSEAVGGGWGGAPSGEERWEDHKMEEIDGQSGGIPLDGGERWEDR